MCGLVVLTPSVEGILCSFLVAIYLRRFSLCCGVRSLEKNYIPEFKTDFWRYVFGIVKNNFLCALSANIIFNGQIFPSVFLPCLIDWDIWTLTSPKSVHIPEISRSSWILFSWQISFIMLWQVENC